MENRERKLYNQYIEAHQLSSRQLRLVLETVDQARILAIHFKQELTLGVG